MVRLRDIRWGSEGHVQFLESPFQVWDLQETFFSKAARANSTPLSNEGRFDEINNTYCYKTAQRVDPT